MNSRILHIDSGSEWRGGQRQLYLLAQAQRDEGLEPLVLGQPRSRLVTRLRRAGVASAGVRMRGVWDLAATRRIRKHIRSWGATVVHVHDRRSLALAHTALVGLTEIQLVMSCCTAPVELGAVQARADRVSCFIASSRGAAEELRKQNVAAERIRLVYPGVPGPVECLPRSWRDEFGWPAESVVCGIMGLGTNDDFAMLRRVLSAVDRSERGQLRIILLGGVAGERRSIAGIDTVAVGIVDHVPAAIAGVNLICSVATSGTMATVILDALSLGVPPLAFQTASISDYIENGVSGIVVESGNAAALGAALSKLVRSPELRARLAEAGPPRAALFNVARMAAAVLDAYTHGASLRAGLVTDSKAS